MLKIEAKMFLSSQRGWTQFDGFRRFSTFNYELYFKENKEPFGALKAFNEETLAAGNIYNTSLDKNTDLLILPLVGGVEITNKVGYQDIIDVGQVQLFSVRKKMSYTISNPYKSSLISYLHILIEKNNDAAVHKNEIKVFKLENKNLLLPIYASNNNQNLAFIGKYEGRKSDIYNLKNTENGVFVFVIHGAFEVANRLLESRDGLALSNIETVEFEALSADAILLLFEIEKVCTTP